MTERMKLAIEYRDLLLEIKELESELLDDLDFMEAVEQARPDIVPVVEPVKKEEPKEEPASQSPIGKRPKIDKGQVLSLANAGWTNSEIAKEVNCTDQYVYQVIKDAKKNGLYHPRKKTTEREDEFAVLKEIMEEKP